MGGHLLVAGGPVPVATVPQLAALAAACWLLGDYLAGRPWFSVVFLAAVQLVVHVLLVTGHHTAVMGYRWPRATTTTRRPCLCPCRSPGRSPSLPSGQRPDLRRTVA